MTAPLCLAWRGDGDGLRGAGVVFVPSTDCPAAHAALPAEVFRRGHRLSYETPLGRAPIPSSLLPGHHATPPSTTTPTINPHKPIVHGAV